MYEKYKTWHDDFIEYINSRQPAVSEYQYADDFINDSMIYYNLLCRISKQLPKWWQRSAHKMIYVSQAEAYGLPYKSKYFQREIEKEKENQIEV